MREECSQYYQLRTKTIETFSPVDVPLAYIEC